MSGERWAPVHFRVFLPFEDGTYVLVEDALEALARERNDARAEVERLTVERNDAMARIHQVNELLQKVQEAAAAWLVCEHGAGCEHTDKLLELLDVENEEVSGDDAP